MEPYSNKLTRIRSTIEEIKEDIEQMKLKNEKTINSMMTITTPYQTRLQSMANANSLASSNNDINNHEPIYQYQITDSKQLSPLETQDICHSNITPNLLNSQYESCFDSKYDMAMQHQNELLNLRVVISEVSTKNGQLTQELKEQRKKNQELQKNSNDYKNILNTIQNMLGVASIDEIEGRIGILNDLTKEFCLRDELIQKLTALYYSLTGTDKCEYVDIKILWRWIKHLISTVKDLAKERAKIMSYGKDHINKRESNEYKDYCMKLMHEYNLEGLEDFKGFIEGLLQRNNLSDLRNNNYNTQRINSRKSLMSRKDYLYNDYIARHKHYDNMKQI